MKVLQINKYHYVKGGTETVFFNTIRLLEENGHQVSRLCLQDKNNLPSVYEKYFVDYPEMSTVGFFKKLQHSFSFFYNQQAKRKIEELILQEKPDVAHIHLLFNGISVSILPVLKKHNIPIVMSVHDYRLICPAYLFLDGENRICEKCKNKYFYRCIQNKCHNKSYLSSAMLALDMYFRNYFYPLTKYVSQFIFVSQFTQNKHASLDKRYRTKGCVLPNYVQPATSAGKHYPSERYYVYYGRLSREKGLHTVVEAAKRLQVNLKVVGTGPLFPQSEEKTPSNIEFLGFLSGEKLSNLLQNAYFVIVPSEWYEPFGLTVVEPQALGTPLIAARIGAIPELISEGENGLLFESGNVESLIKTIQHAETYTQAQYTAMSKRAVERSRLYTSSSSYYKSLVAIYTKAVEEGKSRQQY